MRLCSLQLRKGAGSFLCAVNSWDLQTAKKHAEELDPSVSLSFNSASMCSTAAHDAT